MEVPEDTNITGESNPGVRARVLLETAARSRFQPGEAVPIDHERAAAALESMGIPAGVHRVLFKTLNTKRWDQQRARGVLLSSGQRALR